MDKKLINYHIIRVWVLIHIAVNLILPPPKKNKYKGYEDKDNVGSVAEACDF